MHIIAAKAVCFGEALGDGFRDYAQRVVANARTLAATLRERGIGLVSGGTDNHLLLLDLRQGTAGGGAGLTGKEAEEALHRVGITVNKNAVPGDPQKPWVTSGVRIGTPALTTRGMGEAEMRRIGELIAGVLERPADAAFAREASREVRELADAFPLFTWQPGPRPEVRAG
jgi:glycine hydroxymethyltransferase